MTRVCQRAGEDLVGAGHLRRTNPSHPGTKEVRSGSLLDLPSGTRARDPMQLPQMRSPPTASAPSRPFAQSVRREIVLDSMLSTFSRRAPNARVHPDESMLRLQRLAIAGAVSRGLPRNSDLQSCGTKDSHHVASVKEEEALPACDVPPAVPLSQSPKQGVEECQQVCPSGVPATDTLGTDEVSRRYPKLHAVPERSTVAQRMDNCEVLVGEAQELWLALGDNIDVQRKARQETEALSLPNDSCALPGDVESLACNRIQACLSSRGSSSGCILDEDFSGSNSPHELVQLDPCRNVSCFVAGNAIMHAMDQVARLGSPSSEPNLVDDARHSRIPSGGTSPHEFPKLDQCRDASCFVAADAIMRAVDQKARLGSPSSEPNLVDNARHSHMSSVCGSILAASSTALSAESPCNDNIVETLVSRHLEPSCSSSPKSIKWMCSPSSSSASWRPREARAALDSALDLLTAYFPQSDSLVSSDAGSLSVDRESCFSVDTLLADILKTTPAGAPDQSLPGDSRPCSSSHSGSLSVDRESCISVDTLLADILKATSAGAPDPSLAGDSRPCSSSHSSRSEELLSSWVRSRCFLESRGADSLGTVALSVAQSTSEASSCSAPSSANTAIDVVTLLCEIDASGTGSSRSC